ncbi:methyltransferase domain-containing protein [Sulfoacidibacillus thermotolerans]|uniref:Methyltransferase type 11 domain-containing protein n=1 Tax=Sulfoacidibacillus thermotolerans TaxID=1765684 RepID=A0A2U3D7L5_SULT2|nr:methyltransferase domain-containing protein [Sulfoacidibacillus thermotolerans]PWI57269.1 hypothetical protein BM613_09220 [Sulfoacidibacillus thermotolerans]
MTIERFQMVDQAYTQYIEQHPELEDLWLLEQTVHTARERRGLYAFLPLREGARVLDVGTGFGALATELAFFAPVMVTAVDVDEKKLEIANVLVRNIVEQGKVDWHLPNFTVGDVYELPFAEQSFDLVISRFLFQHLENPVIGMQELFRVLRSGGVACVIDVDEGLSLSYPESNGYQVLHKAFMGLQERAGGDRKIGRKLAHYLQNAGFVGVQSVAQVQSGYSKSTIGDEAVQFVLRRLRQVRDRVLAAGLLTAAEFDAYYDQYQMDAQQWHFETNGQVTAFAVKP